MLSLSIEPHVFPCQHSTLGHGSLPFKLNTCPVLYMEVSVNEIGSGPTGYKCVHVLYTCLYRFGPEVIYFTAVCNAMLCLFPLSSYDVFIQSDLTRWTWCSNHVRLFVALGIIELQTQHYREVPIMAEHGECNWPSKRTPNPLFSPCKEGKGRRDTAALRNTFTICCILINLVQGTVWEGTCHVTGFIGSARSGLLAMAAALIWIWCIWTLHYPGTFIIYDKVARIIMSWMRLCNISQIHPTASCKS